MNGGPVYEDRGGQKEGHLRDDMEFGPCQFERLVRHPSGAAKIVV